MAYTEDFKSLLPSNPYLSHRRVSQQTMLHTKQKKQTKIYPQRMTEESKEEFIKINQKWGVDLYTV